MKSIQKDLDEKLKPYDKYIVLPSLRIEILTDTPGVVYILEEIENLQNRIVEIQEDPDLSENEKKDIEEAYLREIKEMNKTLQGMEGANYAILIDDTFESLERQLYDQRKKSYEIINKVYIQPDEVYSGTYTNNLVHALVYDSQGGTLIAEVYVPIHMSLNTHGLQSLNAWDGNSVEINNEGNYILAPQIGAGKKGGKHNTFTGILMGESVTYDLTNDKGGLKPNSKIGLFGYAEGEQSIFLDAESGAAYFGLPEDRADSGNKHNNGTISLIPNGISHIGSWNLGTNSLFSMLDADGKSELDVLGKPYTGTKYETSIPHPASGVLLTSRPKPYLSIKGSQLPAEVSNSLTNGIDYTRDNIAVQPHDTFELQLDPQDSSIFTLYRHTREPMHIKNVLFKAKQSGSYIVVYNGKDGQPATEYSRYNISTKKWSFSYKFTSSGSMIPVSNSSAGYVVIAKQYFKNGNTSPAYTYYEYKTYKTQGTLSSAATYTEAEIEKQFTEQWRREPKVGIDRQGRFYTNALKDSNTSLYIGSIGAFGKDSKDDQYIGASYEVGDSNGTIFKAFISYADVGTMKELTSPVYIMGSPNAKNSVQRPMHIYGNELTLNAGNCSGESKVGSTRLLLDVEKFYAGMDNHYINLGRDRNNSQIQKSTIYTTYDLLLQSYNSTTLELYKENTKLTSKKIELTSTNDICNLTAGTSVTITGPTSTTINGSDSKLELLGNYAKLSHENDASYLKLAPATNQSTLRSGGSLEISAPGKITIKSNPTANHRIDIDAGDNCYLHLVGGSGKATTKFFLASSCGTLSSTNDKIGAEEGKVNYISASGIFYASRFYSPSFRFTTSKTSTHDIVYDNNGNKKKYDGYSI